MATLSADCRSLDSLPLWTCGSRVLNVRDISKFQYLRIENESHDLVIVLVRLGSGCIAFAIIPVGRLVLSGGSAARLEGTTTS